MSVTARPLFSFDDSYVRQLEGLYEPWQAARPPAPRLLMLNMALAAELGVDFIVKGLRSAVDFEIEQQMALTNYSVTGVRTVYLPCRADRGFISSRFVREIARYGGAIDHLVPAPVATALTTMFPPSATRSHPGSSDDS